MGGIKKQAVLKVKVHAASVSFKMAQTLTGPLIYTWGSFLFDVTWKFPTYLACSKLSYASLQILMKSSVHMRGRHLGTQKGISGACAERHNCVQRQKKNNHLQVKGRAYTQGPTHILILDC